MKKSRMTAMWSLLRFPRILGSVLLAAGFFLPGAAVPSYAIEGYSAILGGLDKVTARVSRLQVGVGQTVRFGELDIILHSCDRSLPTESPESAAFLEINEHMEDSSVERRFIGWMFASSPTVHAMDHGVYDIWVIECLAETGGS